MKIRILRCSKCGNIIVFNEDSGVTPVCCGEKMQVLEAASTDASIEKHVPVLITEVIENKDDHCSGTRFTKKGSSCTYVTVKVGEAAHPMTDDHYIQWIMLVTNCGRYTAFLESGDDAEAVFCIRKGEKIETVYSYCNIHGLWENISD